MNEAETRAEHIDPALKAAGWGVVEGSRIRREYPITPGRIEGHGRRGKPLTADYVLVYRNTKLAVVEAKAWDEPLTEGVAQAKNYAGKLAVRFTYATNGQGIYGIDMQTGTEGEIAALSRRPTNSGTLTFAEAERLARPLRRRAVRGQGRLASRAATTRTSPSSACWRPSPTDQQRILLTLATGTGKTFIAFQIAWKLFHSRWNLSREPTRRPRILFLADRNILADQAYNAFSAFPEDALVRIEPEDIRKKGKVPKNGSLFFTIFQTFMSGPPKDGKPVALLRRVSAGLLRLHRHRRVPSRRRERREQLARHPGVLRPAVQLGLTATPKRKDNVDTYAYFGEPVYIYSLKEGINDGFLTPFKVKQISTTLDEYVYTPDDKLVEGEIEAGKRYDGSRLQQDHRDQGARGAPREDLHGADQPAREDAGLLRHPGPRAGRARPHQPDEDEHGPELLPAGHRRRRRARRAAPARLPGQREDDPDDPDHVAEALDRRGRPQHPQHRADAADQLDDRVQADHRTRHAALRRQGLLHDLRLREGASPLQRSGMGRRADGAGAARADGRADAAEPPTAAGAASPSPNRRARRRSRSSSPTARRAPSST